MYHYLSRRWTQYITQGCYSLLKTNKLNDSFTYHPSTTRTYFKIEGGFKIQLFPSKVFYFFFIYFFPLKYFKWCLLNHFSRVQLFATLWTVACQAPLSMEFSKQEYWSGLPFPSPGDLPNSGIEPVFPVAPALHVDPVPLSHQRSRLNDGLQLKT